MKRYLSFVAVCLVFLANACEKNSFNASDPKHETTGDPNPVLKKYTVNNKTY